MGYSDHADKFSDQHPQVQAAYASARVFTVESKQLERLTLYEQRINRSLQKNLSLLQTLQEQRKEQRRHEIEEAKKLLQLNEMKGLPYEPAKDGFVFSNDQIHAAIDRERRLERVQHLDSRRHKHQKQHANAA
jgi:hypothetical protein